MMKKLVFILTVVAVAGAFFGQHQTNETSQVRLSKKEGVQSPSARRPDVLEVKEPSSEELKTFSIAREEFQRGLSKLRKVTAKYNKKALKGKLTPEDESEYEEAERSALLAYEDYKNSYIEFNHNKEN